MKIEVGKTQDDLPRVTCLLSEQRQIPPKISIIVGVVIFLLGFVILLSGLVGAAVLFTVFTLIFWLIIEKVTSWTSRKYVKEFLLKNIGEETYFVTDVGDISLPAQDLKAFSLSTDDEWTETAKRKHAKAERKNEPSDYINHWLLLVEQKSGAPSIAARHNGSKADMAKLHDTLTREFIYNRQFVE